MAQGRPQNHTTNRATNFGIGYYFFIKLMLSWYLYMFFISAGYSTQVNGTSWNEGTGSIILDIRARKLCCDSSSNWYVVNNSLPKPLSIQVFPYRCALPRPIVLFKVYLRKGGNEAWTEEMFSKMPLEIFTVIVVPKFSPLRAHVLLLSPHFVFNCLWERKGVEAWTWEMF